MSRIPQRSYLDGPGPDLYAAFNSGASCLVQHLLKFAFELLLQNDAMATLSTVQLTFQVTFQSDNGMFKYQEIKSAIWDISYNTNSLRQVLDQFT